MMLTLLGSLCTVTITHADTAKPTLENAHAFIKEMVEQERLRGFDINWGSGKIQNFKSQDCKTSYSFKGMIFDKKPYYHTFNVVISWDKVSDILKGFSKGGGDIRAYDGISVRGSINTDGENSSSAQFDVNDSDITKARLIKAMDFIRQQCDTTKSKYGF